MGDFPKDLEPLDYSPDQLYLKFVIRKKIPKRQVFPVDQQKKSWARKDKARTGMTQQQVMRSKKIRQSPKGEITVLGR